MAQYIVTWDTTKRASKRSTGTFPLYRAGQTAVSNGGSTVTITFSAPMPDLNYTPMATWQNTVDANPQFQPLVITNQTVNGFTVSWNAPTDSANYLMNYYAVTNA